MIKHLIFMALIIVPLSSHADITGAGDAAIVKQLVVQIQKMNESYQALKKQIDIGEKMEKYEQLKTVKKLSEEGEAIKEMIEETNEMMADIQRFNADPLGVKGIQNEMDTLISSLERIGDDSNSARAYSSLLIELQNLKYLGKLRDKSKNKLKFGTTDDEEREITASNTLIMSDILLRNEAEQKRKKVNDTSIIETMLSNPSYKSLAQ